MPSNNTSWTRLEWAVIVILLLGALLRWPALGGMNIMLYRDEAYYGADALSLLQAPQLTPFFPANFGRESAWMYLLAPFVAVFGAQPFGLRLAAAFVGEFPSIFLSRDRAYRRFFAGKNNFNSARAGS